MDSELFLGEEEPDEEGAIETAYVQVCVLSSMKYVLSQWCWNDQLHVFASLLIFVGST